MPFYISFSYNIQKINAFQKNSVLIRIHIICCQNVNIFLIIMFFLFKNQNNYFLLY